MAAEAQGGSANTRAASTVLPVPQAGMQRGGAAAQVAHRVRAAEPVQAVCCHRMSDGSGALRKMARVGQAPSDELMAGSYQAPRALQRMTVAGWQVPQPLSQHINRQHQLTQGLSAKLPSPTSPTSTPPAHSHALGRDARRGGSGAAQQLVGRAPQDCASGPGAASSQCILMLACLVSSTGVPQPSGPHPKECLALPWQAARQP